MARKYKADRSILVKKATIDEMRKLGMKKAIEKANTTDDAEFREAAKRFYGDRIKPVMAKYRPRPGQLGTSRAKGDPAVMDEAPARSHVTGEAKLPDSKRSMSKKASKKNYGSAEV